MTIRAEWKRQVRERPDRPQGRQRRQLDVLVALAAMLAAARKRSGWSVRQAAARVRVASGTIGMLETATRAPSRVVAERLVAAYHLTAAEAGLLLSESVPGTGYDWRQARSGG